MGFAKEKLTIFLNVLVCEPNQHKCADVKCIPNEYVCNYEYDCDDHSDEQNCEPRCEQDEFRCRNNECIFIEYKCNCIDDCSDGSDEDNCDAICN